MSSGDFLTIDLSSYLIDDELIKSVPSRIVSRYQFMPVFKIGKTLTIATSEPENLDQIDAIQKELDLEIDTLKANEEDIKHAIQHHYGVLGTIDDLITQVKQDKTTDDAGPREVLNITDEEDSGSPVVKLINLFINQALIKDASDIHIEPSADDILVRLRVDGDLQELNRTPKKLLLPIVSRIKVLAGMDIAESRVPQDGHIKVIFDGSEIELRISTLPTIHGENLVIRILGRKKSLIEITSLGCEEDDLKSITKLVHLPQGMILVTGPTGSGKTTTLYAALNEINKSTKNIITLEDPVEFELPVIRQVQVNSKAGLTFATGLRSILRQDPDIIMVGEMRDLDTAELGIRASLTGHLVLSTLHTNDAPSSIIRLVDMGIPPFLVASSLTGVVTQRLVRKNCEKCRRPYKPDPEILESLGLDPSEEYLKGTGCKTCSQTGYFSRVGLFEILVMNEAIREHVGASAWASNLRKIAIETGMKTLTQDGILKIKMGDTTAEEVYVMTQSISN